MTVINLTLVKDDARKLSQEELLEKSIEISEWYKSRKDIDWEKPQKYFLWFKIYSSNDVNFYADPIYYFVTDSWFLNCCHKFKIFIKKLKGTIIALKKTIVALIVSLFVISSCSYAPVVDSRGKSSANIDGDMERFHDDLYTCKDIADDNTNEVLNASKKVYNAFRWRLLWMSPKLKTDKDMVDKCLEGRGYNVLG